MIKIIASDLDGTLLPDTKEITPLIIEAIKETKKSGRRFIVTTGRPYSIYVQNLINECDLNKDNYVVVFNGAMVYHDKELIYECTLNDQDIFDIENFTKDYDVCSHVFTTDNVIHIAKDNKYSDFVRSTNNSVAKYETYHHLDKKIVKYSVVGDKAIIQEIIDHLPASFKERFNIFRSYDFLLEFVNKDVDKLNAIKKICAILNIPTCEVMAFGDEENDYHMVEGVGIGVTPISGRDKLKKVAKFTCENNNSDGVAKFILKYLKENEE